MDIREKKGDPTPRPIYTARRAAVMLTTYYFTPSETLTEILQSTEKRLNGVQSREDNGISAADQSAADEP